MNITKLKQQTKRQINYIDRLLADGNKSVNPNPILGTDRERSLKNEVQHQNILEQIERQDLLRYATKLNQDVMQHLSEKKLRPYQSVSPTTQYISPTNLGQKSAAIQNASPAGQTSIDSKKFEKELESILKDGNSQSSKNNITYQIDPKPDIMMDTKSSAGQLEIKNSLFNHLNDSQNNLDLQQYMGFGVINPQPKNFNQTLTDLNGLFGKNVGSKKASLQDYKVDKLLKKVKTRNYPQSPQYMFQQKLVTQNPIKVTKILSKQAKDIFKNIDQEISPLFIETNRSGFVEQTDQGISPINQPSDCDLKQMFSYFNAAEEKSQQSSKIYAQTNGNFLRPKDPLHINDIPAVHGISKKIYRRKEYSSIRTRDPKIIFSELENDQSLPIRKVNIGRKILPDIKPPQIDTSLDTKLQPVVRWKTPLHKTQFTFNTSIEANSIMNRTNDFFKQGQKAPSVQFKIDIEKKVFKHRIQNSVSIRATSRAKLLEQIKNVQNQSSDRPSNTADTSQPLTSSVKTRQRTRINTKQDIEIDEGDIVSDLMKINTVTHGTQSTITPVDSRNPTQKGGTPRKYNCYQQIEILKEVPLVVNLKVQEQCRLLQKKINQKKKAIFVKMLQNESQKQLFVQNIEQKEFLIKVHKNFEQQLAPESQSVNKSQTTDASQMKMAYNEYSNSNSNSNTTESEGGDYQKTSHTPKFDQCRSKVEIENTPVNKNAQIEKQILNLYKNQFQNDYKRQKDETDNLADKVKNQLTSDAEEIKMLRAINKNMKATIKRYMNFVNNFRKDEDNFLSYRENKANQQKPVTPKKQIQKYMTRDFVSQHQLLQKIPEKNDDRELKVQTPNKEVLHTFAPSPSPHRVEEDFVFQQSINILSQSNMNTRNDNQVAASHQSSMMIQEPKNGTFIDVNKLTKFFHQVKLSIRQEKALDIALSIIDLVKAFLGCQKVMLIPLDYFLGILMTSKSINGKEKLQFIQPLDIKDGKDGETKSLAAVVRNPGDTHEMVFESVTDSSEPIFKFKDNKMGIMFKQSNGQGPFFILHVEYDTNVFSEPATQTLSKPQITKKASNWTEKIVGKINRMEGAMSQLVLKSVQVKFETMLMYHNIKRNSNEDEKALQMIYSLCKCTTLRGLMRVMNKVVMNYFAFEEINIMFYDQENENLYTLTFGDDDDHNLSIKNALKKAKTEKERDIIIEKDKMHDVTLKANQMINFPTNQGITNMVFKSQKTELINNFKPSKNFNFLNEIDNPKAIKDIKNLMIGALKREDGTSNGVIQLFNNKNPILKYDQRKYEAIATFLGSCVSKVENKTKKLTTTVAVTMQQDQALDAVEVSLKTIEGENGTIKAYNNILKPLEVMDSDLRKNWNLANYPNLMNM